MRSLESLSFLKKQKSQHNRSNGARATAWTESGQCPPRLLRGRCLLSPHGISIGDLHRQSITALPCPWGHPGSQVVVSTSRSLLLKAMSRIHQDVKPVFPVSASHPKLGRGCAGFSCLLGRWDQNCTTGIGSENGPFSLGFFLLTENHLRKYFEKMVVSLCLL